jgi:hypothetical protein
MSNTNSTVRFRADAHFGGALIIGTNHEDFPPEPKPNSISLVQGAIWAYTTVAGIPAWFPLTNPKNSAAHHQAIASAEWTVNHGLGTTDVIFVAYHDDGSIIQGQDRVLVDDDSFKITMPEAFTGSAVIFADAQRFLATVEAGNVNALTLDVAGVVTANSSGLFINGVAVQVAGASYTKSESDSLFSLVGTDIDCGELQ